MMSKPTIAIVSIGTMGMGLAKILIENGYSVMTNLDGRSAKTTARAESVGILSRSLPKLLRQATLVLSIVPPAEAMETAQSIASATKEISRELRTCTFIDLNAITKSLSLQISEVITAVGLRYIDGGILGRPPTKVKDGSWSWIAVLMSGPRIEDCLPERHAAELTRILSIRPVGEEIGAASALKMCFSAFYKGQAAIMIQAYTTAANLGCLPALRQHLQEYSPRMCAELEASVVDMQHKAYRWITEMGSIGETFSESGGWSPDLFRGVRNVYEVINETTDLGPHGKTSVQDVIGEICKGLSGQNQSG